MARLLPVLAVSLLLFLLPSISTSLPLRLELTHVDSKYSNLSMADRLRRAVKRSEVRMASIASMLSASHVDVQTTTHRSGGEYNADFAIGTPPVSLTAILDTGSELVWTKCEPGSPFNYSASSTFSPVTCGTSFCLPERTDCANVTCGYSLQYGSGSSAGFLATETLAIGAATVPGFAFGCSTSGQGISNIPGILGMGRESLSLVSQLGSGKFSYCFTRYDESTTSPLLFGSLVPTDASAKSTPFVSSPTTHYYLSLRGISVGGTLLPIPSSTFAVTSNGQGGLVIDSGTSITRLASSAYDALKEAFVAQMGLPVANSSGVGLDLCFSFPADSNVNVPPLVFHFDGADMDLPLSNYFVKVFDNSGKDLLLCLVILPSNFSFSIFGNFQQQNMHFVYDLVGGKLSFAPAQCHNM